MFLKLFGLEVFIEIEDESRGKFLDHWKHNDTEHEIWIGQLHIVTARIKRTKDENTNSRRENCP